MRLFTLWLLYTCAQKDTWQANLSHCSQIGSNVLIVTLSTSTGCLYSCSICTWLLVCVCVYVGMGVGVCSCGGVGVGGCRCVGVGGCSPLFYCLRCNNAVCVCVSDATILYTFSDSD